MNINLTLLGQAITFGLFVWFTMRFVWPPITSAMHERQTKIADGLAAAKRGEETLEKAQLDATELLRDAKVKAAEILEHANKRASQIVEESKVVAREEGHRLVLAARSEIDQEKLQAREQLRREVVQIAVLGAEKILGKSIDTNVHDELLTKLAANM